jgi:hypothetical protein
MNGVNGNFGMQEEMSQTSLGQPSGMRSKKRKKRKKKHMTANEEHLDQALVLLSAFMNRANDSVGMQEEMSETLLDQPSGMRSKKREKREAPCEATIENLFKEVLLQHMLQHVIPGKNSSSLPFKDAFIQDRPTNATSSRNPAGSKYEHCQWFRLLAKTAADLGDEYEKALKHVRNTHGCNFARRMCRSLNQMFKSVEEEDTCVRHLTTQP